MLHVLKPPAPLIWDEGLPSVFLAGSIEMGGAEDWQATMTDDLADLNAVILNPRREEWNASWEQTAENPLFREQVEWELAALERADVIALYFAPQTKSPVSLLELGLHARSGKLLVSCPEGFWRRGNVQIVCRKYGVLFLPDIAALVAEVRSKLK